MADYSGLIVVLAIYLLMIAGSGKKKKKAAQRRRGPMRTAAEGEQHDVHSTQRTDQAMRGFAAAFEPDPDCAARPIHLHPVDQTRMQAAGEGEDPCHAGGVQPSERDDPGIDALAAGEPHALAEDVLRGVIMSEILTRPCERAVIRKNRRSV